MKYQGEAQLEQQGETEGEAQGADQGEAQGEAQGAAQEELQGEALLREPADFDEHVILRVRNASLSSGQAGTLSMELPMNYWQLV